MIEILALFALTALGTAFATFRSRRRFLARRYTRFAIFEHLVLPWVVCAMLGYAAYFFPNMLSLSGEEFVLLVQFALIVGAALCIFVTPLAIFLIVIMLAPAYLPLPIETAVPFLFVLKAIWFLLGASALGNVIGYMLGRRQRAVLPANRRDVAESRRSGFAL